jgi:hypothetical protein
VVTAEPNAWRNAIGYKVDVFSCLTIRRRDRDARARGRFQRVAARSKCLRLPGQSAILKRTLLRNNWGMETPDRNINVIRSVWRQIEKADIKVLDLQPVKDVKGGGGVTGKSKPMTRGTGSH